MASLACGVEEPSGRTEVEHGEESILRFHALSVANRETPVPASGRFNSAYLEGAESHDGVETHRRQGVLKRAAWWGGAGGSEDDVGG